MPTREPIEFPPQEARPTNLPTLRAAYSDRTAALMGYLAGFAYDPRIAAPGPLSVPPELLALGFDRLTSFHNGMTNGWAYIAQGKDLIVLSFRGTYSIQDWNTNFHVELIHPEHTDPRLRVHKGFYEAFEKLSNGKQGIRSKIEEIRGETHEAVAIYITGHSLGGALAQIAAAVLGKDDVAACYTFGSPRVGNSTFDLWVKVPSYRLINYADIVPQVPFPLFYRHSGDPRYMPDAVTYTPYRFEPNPFERVWQLLRGLFQLFRSWSILGIKDHDIGEYCKKLNKIAGVRTQAR
jgi:triacylglycerol lipase